MSADTLQLVSYINIFVVGIVVAIVIQRVFVKYRPHKDKHQDQGAKEVDDVPTPPADMAAPTEPAERPALTTHESGEETVASAAAALESEEHLSPIMRELLLDDRENQLESTLSQTADKLSHDLNIVSDKLATHLDKLGTTIINTEMERYGKQLEQLREQAEQAIGNASAATSKHQSEIDAKLEEQRAALEAQLKQELEIEKKQMTDKLTAEHEQLLKQLDTKLGDAMMSFLMETLQHNVDLGAQSNYLVAMLEEHKDDFKRDLQPETASEPAAKTKPEAKVEPKKDEATPEAANK